MAYIGNFPAEKYTTFSKQTFTPDGSTTSFTLDFSVANENDLELFVNNVRQEPGSGKAYTATGLTLTMSSAPGASDDMYAIFQGKAQQTVTPGPQTVTGSMLATDIAISTSGNITATGLTVDGNASIGTNTTGLLSVKGGSTTSPQIRFFDGGTARARIGVPTGTSYLSLSGSDTLTADVVVNSSGNVGIGTTSPAFISGKGLRIQNSGTATLRLQDDGVHGFEIRASSTTADFVSANAKPFIFDNGTTEIMRIDSSGNVGIGTSSPDGTLHVFTASSGTVTANGNADDLVIENNGTTGLSILSSSGQNGNIYFGTPDDNKSAEVVWVDGNDQLLIGTSSAGGNIKFRTGAQSDAVVIDSSGLVGIGTTSPEHALDVTSSASVPVRIQSTASSNMSVEINAPTGYNANILFKENDANAFFIGHVASDSAFYFYDGSANSERMRIDSSGVVNVGTTTPVAGATALSADGISGFQNQGNYAININRQTNDGALINFQRGGDTRGFIGIGDSDLYIGKTDGGTDCFLRFGFSNSQIIPASSSGGTNDNALDLGAPTSRFNDLYMGGNIYLGGTGSANGLDTYEEGTWTPSLTSSGGSISVSYGTRAGKYTRVGNIVHCSFSMRVASHSGGSGEYRVSGLPFTSNTAGNDHIGVTTAGLEGHPFTSSTQLLQVIDNLTTYVRLLRGNNVSSWSSYTPQSGSSVYMSFTYPINQ